MHVHISVFVHTHSFSYNQHSFMSLATEVRESEEIYSIVSLQ